jgi:hypothetical protein
LAVAAVKQAAVNGMSHGGCCRFGASKTIMPTMSMMVCVCLWWWLFNKQSHV